MRLKFLLQRDNEADVLNVGPWTEQREGLLVMCANTVGKEELHHCWESGDLNI